MVRPRSGARLAVFSVLAFLAVLLALFLFRYLRLRGDYALGVLATLARPEMERVQGALGEVEKGLLFLGDLGRHGLLRRDDTRSLNRRLFPFLENHPLVGAVILADDRGWEYLVHRDGEGFLTRVTRQVGEGAEQVFTRWRSAEEPLETWTKTARYDPRKRPWFRAPGKGVRWTSLYHFFLSGERGLTASVSWRGEGGAVVLGADLPASRLKEVLSPKGEDFPGVLLLLDVEHGAFLAADEGSLPAEELEPLLERLPPAGAPQRVSLGGEVWVVLVSRPFLADEGLRVAALAPEGALLARLRKTVFRLDPLDLLAAVLGGLVLLAVLRRAGGCPRGGEERDPFARLLTYLRQGEGSRVEFKSSVRLNLRTGKPGKEIELAWLKAVAAFLNSEGGVVLLGVDDSGEIVGVEQDGFENLDRLQLHLKNLVNQHLGAELSRYIEVTPVEVDGRTVVMIEVRPAPEPVFLRVGKTEEFYIRSGPSSVKLSPSQTLTYVLQGRGRK